MTLEQIWKKIGIQQSHIARHTKAMVIIDNEKLPIEKIVYENGKPIGFKVTHWHDADDYPEKDRYITVIDKNGREYKHHTWSGRCYYNWIFDSDGADGFPTDVEVYKWRYKD